MGTVGLIGGFGYVGCVRVQELIHSLARERGVDVPLIVALNTRIGTESCTDLTDDAVFEVVRHALGVFRRWQVPRCVLTCNTHSTSTHDRCLDPVVATCRSYTPGAHWHLLATPRGVAAYRRCLPADAVLTVAPYEQIRPFIVAAEEARVTDARRRAFSALLARSVGTPVLGCTELSVYAETRVAHIDSAFELARAVLDLT